MSRTLMVNCETTGSNLAQVESNFTQILADLVGDTPPSSTVLVGDDSIRQVQSDNGMVWQAYRTYELTFD